MSWSRSEVVSGTNQVSSAIASMSSLSASPPAASSARRRSLACSTPTMFSWLAAPERQARIGRGQDLAHDLLGGEIGVDGPHLGAVDHHVRDRRAPEVEQAAEHVALGLRDAALPVQQVDLAADFLGRRQDRLVLADADAEGRSISRTSRSMASVSGPSSATARRPGARGTARRCRAGDRDGLRQHLGEDDHQDRHDDRRVDHAAVAEEGDQHACGEGGRADIARCCCRSASAPMKRSRWFEQPVDDAGAAVAAVLQASMRAREAAVNAVSAAEKNADSPGRRSTISGGEPEIDGDVLGHGVGDRSSGAEFAPGRRATSRPRRRGR